MSYSEHFETALSEKLTGLFHGAVQIDTQAINNLTDANALAETWLKAGESLGHYAITTEDKFAVFQIQSLGLLMEAMSYALPPKRKR